MANPILIDLIYKEQNKEAVDEAKAALESMTEEEKQAAAAAQDAAREFKVFGLSLTDLKSGLELAGMAGDMLGKIFDATAGKAVAYAREVGDLSREIGATSEESSKLLQVADDLKVDTGALKIAFKELIKDGTQPSIETLKRLASEYQAIQDPVKKSQFALEKFGRSGLEMTKMLEATPDELDEMARSAEEAGLVLSKDMVDAARKLEQNLDNLSDKVEGFGIRVGNFLVEQLNSAATSFDILIDGSNKLRAAFEEHRTDIVTTSGTYADYRAELLRSADAAGQLLPGTYKLITSGKLNEEQIGNVVDNLGGMTKAQFAAARSSDIISAAMDETARKAKEAAAANRDVAAATRDTGKEFQFLQAVIAGPVGKAHDEFISKQDELKNKQAELLAELDKLEAGHGRAVAVKQKQAMTDAELALAQDNARVASERLTEAQAKLAESADPAAFADLNREVLQAQVAYDNAAGKINTAAEATTRYVDNSKRIGEIRGQLDDVSAALGENTAAHDEHLKRFLFNIAAEQMAADGLSANEIAALKNIGVEWKIYDQQTGEAISSVLLNTALLAKSGDLDAFQTNMNRTLGSVGDDGGAMARVTASVQEMHREVQDKMAATATTTADKTESIQGNFKDAQKSVDEARNAIKFMHDEVASFPDETHKTIIFDIVTNGSIPDIPGVGGGGGTPQNNRNRPGRAMGGPFMAGGAYLFNESPATRPETIIANSSGGGYVLTRQDAMRALAGAAGGMPPININVYAAPGMDEQALARQVNIQLGALLRQANASGMGILGFQ